MGVITKPSDVVPVPARQAGGDNEVPRDALGRPRIWVPCQDCDETGKVPSPKTGNPIKCTKCKGEGRSLRSYTRTTTYIDVLDDKTNIEAWKMRMVLLGIHRDPSLLRDLAILDETRDDKESKDEMNRRSQIAMKGAGAEDKADKGTFLHGLSELRDTGQDLPAEISFEDVIDLDAYSRISEGFDIVYMENLVVQDELKIGGTPDRVSRWAGEGDLVAPDGTVIGRDESLITDLKTGTVEYGALKMAMQLAIYSRSDLYDHETGTRTPLESINQDWGVIMNVPAGSGEGACYWADLSMGWEAVLVAGMVRRLRGTGKRALSPMIPSRPPVSGPTV